MKEDITKSLASSVQSESHSNEDTPMDCNSQLVYLSKNDAAFYLTVSPDNLSVCGNKGYGMIRAVQSVSEGTWYYEVKFEDMKSPNSHMRIGWATKEANVQAPVGYDQYGYAYGDRHGACIHESLRNDSYGEKYGIGDVIGCMIHLVHVDKENFEEKATVIEQSQECLNPSWIKFFKNGIDQGIAYSNITYDTYFPAISVYGEALAKVNFGPSFDFPPPLTTEWKALEPQK